jgi:flagellar hook-associated protein 1 FlgK
MGLLSILNTAANSLLNVQTQINTVSDNVGNSNTPNFASRTATVVENNPTGADSVVIGRAVNTTLQQEVFAQSSASAGATFTNNIYTQLEQLDGSASGTPTLSSTLESFVNAVSNFQATPEDQSSQQQVIQAGQNFANAIQTIGAGVAQIQSQVSTQTTNDVSTLNKTLASISALNSQIVAAKAVGQPTAALEDSRDAAVSQVAALVPVQVQQNSDGSETLNTPSGVQLVGLQPASFGYNAATNTVFSTGDPAQTPLNATFTSGQISAELATLDTSAAGVASSSPSQAPLQKVTDQLNALVGLFVNPAAPNITPAGAGVPTAIQAAYDNATPVNAGELPVSLFTVPAGTTPATLSFNFQVNANLLNGTDTLKQSSATPLLNALNAANLSFNVGGVSLTNSNVATIAQGIASGQTARAQQAQSTQQASSTALTATQTSFDNATGVNVDQQLAQLIVLQNSYGASAKIISVVDQLFTLLQGIGPTTG